MTETIQVVVVDDSPFVCRLLTSYLQSADGIRVVGTAGDGLGAVEMAKRLRPHALTLDLEMPGVSGLETLDRIMHECPTPVVLVSGVSRRAAAVTLEALERGAVDYVLKYAPGVNTDPDLLRQEIVTKVRVASRIKVIRSLQAPRRLHRPAGGRSENKEARRRGEEVPGTQYPVCGASSGRPPSPFLPGGLVVIGASTGGPAALRELLENLPAKFPASVLVVQHMPPAFTGVLAAQLDRQVPLPVREARGGDPLQAGLALVAPGDYHLLVTADSRVELNRGPAIGGHRPSIDVTMQSAAQVYGSRVRGVVLTGMGEDGSQGLVAIHGKGGKTFAQDGHTCVVNGMPQKAIDRGVVDHVASPADIARLLRGE
jgi:two-component system chemotaxis response regulator CheB